MFSIVLSDIPRLHRVHPSRARGAQSAREGRERIHHGHRRLVLERALERVGAGCEGGWVVFDWSGIMPSSPRSIRRCWFGRTESIVDAGIMQAIEKAAVLKVCISFVRWMDGYVGHLWLIVSSTRPIEVPLVPLPRPATFLPLIVFARCARARCSRPSTCQVDESHVPRFPQLDPTLSPNPSHPALRLKACPDEEVRLGWMWPQIHRTHVRLVQCWRETGRCCCSHPAIQSSLVQCLLMVEGTEDTVGVRWVLCDGGCDQSCPSISLSRTCTLSLAPSPCAKPDRPRDARPAALYLAYVGNDVR